MRIALYARVSKDEDATDARYQNPENQLVMLRDYCKRQEWTITNEFVDFASGADPKRPQFRKIIDGGFSREYDAILIWKLDRFSREPLLSTLYYIQRLRDAHIALISMTETWLDTRQENPMTDLVLAIMSWMAAEERRKISERTKAGIARRRAIGQWKGGRPRKKGVPLTNEDKIAQSKTPVLPLQNTKKVLE